jgi:cullin 1
MCTQEGDFSSELYDRHGSTIRDYLQSKVLPALQNTSSTCPTLFLQEVDCRWSNHCIMTKWLEKFFSYLDRTIIPQFSLPTLRDVACQVFEQEAYQPLVKTQATQAILQLIARERQGHLIENKSLVKRIVELYQAMGKNRNSRSSSMGGTTLDSSVGRASTSDTNCYHVDLELPLLNATRKYYQQKRRDYIAAVDFSTPVYLERAEEALSQEKGRASDYFNTTTASSSSSNTSTEASLLAVVEQELLVQVQDVLLENKASGCRALLDNDKSSDLQRMFRLFSRLEKKTPYNPIPLPSDVAPAAPSAPAAAALGVPSPVLVVDPEGDELVTPTTSALKRIAAIVEEYITDCGNDIIDGRKARYVLQGGGQNNNNKDKNDKLEDSKFVKALMELHDKQLAMVKRDFNGHAFFQRSLKRAFDKIVNTQVSNGGGNTNDGEVPTNAELLSTYCDGILRGKLSDQQVEEGLECIAQLFCYLQDKDLFAEIYRNQLSRRLLDSRSISTSRDAEKYMIAKLKVQCGTQFTSKMEGMFTDICLGQDQKQAFEQHLRKQSSSSSNLTVDLSVQVLSRGFWPTYKELSTVTLPLNLCRCMEVYQAWHEQQHAKRRLTWVLTQGSALVRATFAKKTYDLQVSILQAIVLDALAGGIMQSFEDLARILNLDASILKPILHSLSCGKYKVIRKSPASNKMLPTDTFIANKQFSASARKFRIPAPSLESMLNVKKVHADRSIAIDARIVRIMKSRKTLGHQQLISEVMAQLSLFKPNARDVKRRIEALIEKEYLERSAENNGVYNYLA